MSAALGEGSPEGWLCGSLPKIRIQNKDGSRPLTRLVHKEIVRKVDASLGESTERWTPAPAAGLAHL
jgi:hypothetical protein